MTTLASTQAGAHDALLALLRAAAETQSPVVPVFDTFIPGEYEPATYSILWGTNRPDQDDADQEWTPAALGSFAFYETFTLYGQTSIVQGDTDPKTVRDNVWALFNDTVMSVVVANRGFGGTPVLGSGAPSELEQIVPTVSRPLVRTGTIGGGQAGTMGVVEWAFELQARVTIG